MMHKTLSQGSLGYNFHVSLLVPTLNAALPTKISLQQGDCNCGEGMQVQLYIIYQLPRSCKCFTVECDIRYVPGVTTRLPKWPFKAFLHAVSTVATKPSETQAVHSLM